LTLDDLEMSLHSVVAKRYVVGIGDKLPLDKAITSSCSLCS